jgi:uncharacterized protein with HEPN domain
MIHDDKIYLKHIIDAILFIEKHCGKINSTQFYKDEVLQSAIVRQLEIIGEAAKSISKSTKTKLNEIEWNKVIGMRNKLIHEYFGVDLNVVWATIKEELPRLKKYLVSKFSFDK